MRKTIYRFKRKLIRRLHELKAYFFYFKKTRKISSKRVVIFAQGRTGSTLLEDLLDSTSHFKKRGELLGHHGAKVLYPFNFIIGLSKIKPDENFIFHLKIYHLTRDRKNKIEPSEFLKKLYLQGWKVIYLNRQNKLNHVLSNLVAEKRGYFKFDNKKEDIKLNIDPVTIKNGIEERINFECDELDVLENLDYLKITYEENLENANNHQETVDKILDFLKLERRRCNTKYRKVNQSSQKELIENFEEIINFLEEKNYSKYIE